MCSVEAYSVCPDEGLDAVGDRQCHIACYGAGTANRVGHNQVHRVPAVVPNNVLLRGWRGVDVERRSGCCGEAQHGVHRLIVCCCGCRAINVGKCLVGRGDADRLIPCNGFVKHEAKVTVCRVAPSARLVTRAQQLEAEAG